MNKYIILLLLFLGAAHSAHADASLSLTPATGIYPIGEPFTVEVRLDSGGSEVGSADLTLAYEPSDIEYVGVSDDGSIFSTILVDSSTNPGRLDLSGFIARGRQAFTGSDGLVARVTFMPLRNVATEVRFAAAAATPPLSLGASVGDLANVLTSLRTATYTLVPRETVAPALANVAYAQEDTAFEITLLPVPENDWLAATSAKLSWTLPDGVLEMRTAVSKDPNTMPSKVYPIPVSTVLVDDLEVGEQYFLMQFKEGEIWGPIMRRTLNVDLTGPSYLVAKEQKRADPSDPRVGFVIEAKDGLSGISHYDIAIDGGEGVRWERPESGMYQPDDLRPGEHVLTVTAFDRAGNSTSTDVVFLMRSLDPPVLTDAPDYVLAGDTITVRGTTYPNASVTVFTSHNDGEASERAVTSDEAGAFVATIADGARAGKYTVWFKVADSRGAESPLSIKRSIEVKQPYIMLFGSIAVTYLSVIVPLVALIFLLSLVLWLGYAYVRNYRRRVKREANEAFHVVRGEFDDLREDLIKQIGMLEKANQSRELTKEEMRIFNELSKRLSHIEEHIAEEVDDIAPIDGDTEPRHAETARPRPQAAATHASHTVRIERR